MYIFIYLIYIYIFVYLHVSSNWEPLLTEVHFEEFGGESNNAMDKLERSWGSIWGVQPARRTPRSVFMTKDEAP